MCEKYFNQAVEYLSLTKYVSNISIDLLNWIQEIIGFCWSLVTRLHIVLETEDG